MLQTYFNWHECIFLLVNLTFIMETLWYSINHSHCVAYCRFRVLFQLSARPVILVNYSTSLSLSFLPVEHK